MAFSLTTNYAGIASSSLISAAINAAPTVGGNAVTVMPNIKHKMNVRKADWSTNLIQAAACDYNSQGTLTLAEVILDPTDLMTNQTLCKSTLEAYWLADQMRAGALNSDFTQEFTDYVVTTMMGKIGEGLEFNLWSGNIATTPYSGATTSGYSSFDGFIKTFVTAGGTVQPTGFVITDANVISAMTTTFTNVPGRVINPQLTFYVSPKTAALYEIAIAAKSNETYFLGNRNLNFLGYRIVVSAGIPDNHIICADPANLFVGTDLLSDANNVQVIDMQPIDGSMNVRMVARYKFGVQVGYTGEVVWFHP